MGKRILVLSNHFITLYNFRKELITKLVENGNEVFISMPKANENSFFSGRKCKVIETPVDRRGVNPIKDFQLILTYIKIIKNLNPDIILTYTIKPNIYGGIAARLCRKSIIHTVTGLGSVYIQDMWQKKIAVFLNKIAFKSASKVFFLNKDNKKFYEKLGIITQNQSTMIVPGSGVNLEQFRYVEQHCDSEIIFTFIGRVLKDKGIEEYLTAAKELREIYNNVKFEVVGFVEEEKYIDLLKSYEKNGIIEYLGKRDDIPEIMARSSCIVLPSYGEGRGTVLQEGAAIGRPLITCDTYGCKENVEDGYNGYLCKRADAESLKKVMGKFINLPQEDKFLMGKKGREKAEKEFDRKIVTNAYINNINNVCERGK